MLVGVDLFVALHEGLAQVHPADTKDADRLLELWALVFDEDPTDAVRPWHGHTRMVRSHGR